MYIMSCYNEIRFPKKNHLTFLGMLFCQALFKVCLLVIEVTILIKALTKRVCKNNVKLEENSPIVLERCPQMCSLLEKKLAFNPFKKLSGIFQGLWKISQCWNIAIF